MRVEIKAHGATMLSVKSLRPFQGNLKSLSEKNYNKLKKEIVELGFSEPLSVWKHEDINYILNGHQRLRTIQKMIEEGYECPALPVNWVDANDYNDAKRKVLALTSQYGKIENDGLYEFISDSDITVDYIEESFHFPEVNIDKFKEEYYEPTSDQDLGSEEAIEDKEWLIVCEMKNEIEQSALFEKLTHEGIKCKLM